MDYEWGKYRIVYVTPEFVVHDRMFFYRLHLNTGLDMVAIDEAHCVSQWGHDFRKCYGQLRVLRRGLTKVPFVALTATTTTRVTRDIISSLALREPVMTIGQFNRPNLYIAVKLKNNKMDVMTVIGSQTSPTIIYTITRKEADNVCAFINDKGLKAVVYHSGMSTEARTYAQDNFHSDSIKILVATTAYGMGTHKDNIRNIIHWGAPGDLLTYYQQIGRGGRDGNHTKCTMFYTSNDFTTHSTLGHDDNPQMALLKKESSASMKYFVTTSQCRRRHLLRYLHGDASLETQANCCDNCNKQSEPPQQLVDYTVQYRLLAGTIKATGGKLGMIKPILILRGSFSKGVVAYTRLHLFGKGKRKSKQWWTMFGRQLLAQNYLKETEIKGSLQFHSYTVDLSDKGLAALESHMQVLLPILPTESDPCSTQVDIDDNNNVTKPETFVPASSSTPVTKETSDDTLELYRELVGMVQNVAVSEGVDCWLRIFDHIVILETAKQRITSPEQFQKLLQSTDPLKIPMSRKYMMQILARVTAFCRKHNI